MTKIFIIGLPRTGTTSISVALLNYGFKVAHTAFTQHAFEIADVVSDAPCFSDYPQLDRLFPGAKFIYLKRGLDKWVPSMQRLLTKMSPQLLPKTGHFSPVLKRSFAQVFDTTSDALLSTEHLTACYKKHQHQVTEYFKDREDLLSIDIIEQGSFQQLLQFLGIEGQAQSFPHLNQGSQVANWKAYKHINKVNSYSAGKAHRKFFDYL